MDYNAKYFADLFVEVAHRASSRRSFAKGISSGTGNIPYDTGASQRSIYVARYDGDSATVEIGGDPAPYDIYLQYANNVGNTTVTNRHKGFVQRFARQEFVAALAEQFKEIEIS